MAKQKTEAQLDRYSRFGAPGQWLGALVVGTVSASSTFVNLVRTKFHDDSEFRQGFSVLHEAKNLDLKTLNDTQIQKTMGILENHVGDHPSFLRFKKARDTINLVGTDIEAVKKLNPKFDVGILFTEYANSNTAFLKDCKEGIDKAMKSPEYKKLAIKSSIKQSATKGHYDRLYDSFAETLYGIKSKGIIGHTQGVWERFVGFGSYTKRNMLLKTGIAAGVAFGGTMMVFNQINTRDKLNDIDKQSERADRKLDALLDKAGIGEHEIETREEHRAHVRESEKAEDRALRKGGRHANKVIASRDSKPSASNDNKTIANDNEHEYRHAASLAAERDAQLDAAEIGR